MAKYKAGLHKRISAIFDGVPISRNDNTGQLPAVSERKSSDCASPKPSVMERSLSSSSPPRQTTRPLPEAGSSKQSVITGTIVKTFRQIKNKFFVPKAGVNANRQRKMVILTSVLLVIFIFVIIRVLNQPSPTAARAQDLGATNVGSSVAISEKKVNWTAPEPYPTTLRDPMQAGLTAGGQGGSGSLVVKGIVYSEDRPSAVVGNQIIHQGDKILGVTAVKINKNNVEFEMDGKKWTQEVQR